MREYEKEAFRVITATNAITNFRDVVVYNDRIETSNCIVTFMDQGVSLSKKGTFSEMRWCISLSAAETNEFLARHME